MSEKCSDFCQDDLADDDIMILDTGVQVLFLLIYIFAILFTSLPFWMGLCSFSCFHNVFAILPTNLIPGVSLDGSKMFRGGDKAGLQVSSGKTGMLSKALIKFRF